MDVLTEIIRKEQFRKRVQRYFEHVGAICDRELDNLFSKATSKAAHVRVTGKLPVAVLALIKVFLGKCASIKDGLRSKIHDEIFRTSNLVGRVIIEREPADCLSEIGDHIQSMCTEISAWWNSGLSRLGEDRRDFEEVEMMFNLIEDVPRRTSSAIISTDRLLEESGHNSTESVSDSVSIERSEGQTPHVTETSVLSEASDLASEIEPEYLTCFEFDDGDDYPTLCNGQDGSSVSEEGLNNAADVNRIRPQTEKSQDIHAEALTALRELKGLLNLLAYRVSSTHRECGLDNVHEDRILRNGNCSSMIKCEQTRDCRSAHSELKGGTGLDGPFGKGGQTQDDDVQRMSDDERSVFEHSYNGKGLPGPIRQLAGLIDFLEEVVWPLTNSNSRE